MSNLYYSTTHPSPLGQLTLASDGEALVGLWLPGQKYFGGTAPGAWVPTDELPVFLAAKAWLDAYFAGKRPEISQRNLSPAGSPFRRMVWEMLLEIPYGKTTTYGEIARKVAARSGKPSISAQAVGGAVGHNPISLIIPCHRVVGAKGRLTGYAGGLDKKVWLLQHEGVDLSQVTASGEWGSDESKMPEPLQNPVL